MAWGHRLKRLTKKEQKLCRTLGWCCANRACKAAAEYMSNYSYRSAHGHVAHVRRPFCPAHARQYAMRYTLAWPTRDRQVKIRLDDLLFSRAA